MNLQLRKVDYIEPTPEDYKNFSQYLKNDVHAQRVLESELMQMYALRNAITGKQLKDEDLRLSFSFLDGQIHTYSGLISGEFVPPVALTKTEVDEED